MDGKAYKVASLSISIGLLFWSINNVKGGDGRAEAKDRWPLSFSDVAAGLSLPHVAQDRGLKKKTTSMGNTRRAWGQRSKLQFKQQLLEVDECDGAGINCWGWSVDGDRLSAFSFSGSTDSPVLDRSRRVLVYVYL